MTEEAIQPVANENTKTEEFVPAWKIKADKLKKGIEQDLGVQVVFRSDNNVACEPTLVSEKQESNSYPYVVEEPAGFIAPKYEWFGTRKGWIETANIKQGQDLAKLQEQVNTLQGNVDSLADTKQAVANDKQELMGQIQELKNSDKENTKSLAQILTMVSMLAAQKQPASPTNSNNVNTTQDTAPNSDTEDSTQDTKPVEEGEN